MPPKSIQSILNRSNKVCVDLKGKDLKQRKKLLKHLKDSDLTALGNCFSSLVTQKKYFQIPTEQGSQVKSVFSPHKSTIKKFVNSDNKSRRKIIQKGGFFTAILAATIPLIAELVAHLVKTYV